MRLSQAQETNRYRQGAQRYRKSICASRLFCNFASKKSKPQFTARLRRADPLVAGSAEVLVRTASAARAVFRALRSLRTRTSALPALAGLISLASRSISATILGSL